MSNCTVNKCMHTVSPWTDSFPTPEIGGTSNPMCSTDLTDSKVYPAGDAERDKVLATCSSKKGCFTNYKCVDGQQCQQLFTDLMSQGWGDKDNDESVLYKLNHASPENLRDQLKFELCRRAACMPKPSSVSESGIGWWKRNVVGTWYTGILYVLALIPIIWIVGSFYYWFFKGIKNVTPTVLAGLGNDHADTTAGVFFCVLILLFLILMSGIFARYSLETSLTLFGVLFLAFAPMISFRQRGFIGAEIKRVMGFLALLKFILFGVLVRYFTKNISSLEKDYALKNFSETSILNAVLYGLLGLMMIGLSWAEGKDKIGMILGVAIIIAAGFTGGIGGTDKDNQDTGKENAVLWIAMGIPLALVMASLASPNNTIFTFSYIISFMLLFSMMDTSGLLQPQNNTPLTTIITVLTIACVMGSIGFIKGKSQHFKTLGLSAAAASFFVTSASMAGLQTFMGIFMPPIQLTLLVFQRVLISLIYVRHVLAGKTVTTNKNTWSFLFDGDSYARVFNKVMTDLINQFVTTSEAKTAALKNLFTHTENIGVENSKMFIS